MNSEIVKKENNEITLKIVVDKGEFNKAVNEAYKKTKHRFNVPGFRKGKAPKQIIQQRYGKEVFFEEAINIAFPKAYEKALDDLKIDPVNQPEIDIENVDPDSDLSFTAKIEIMPEIEISDYKGLSAEKTKVEVAEEEIEEELKKLQEQNARMLPVEDREAKDGDILTIDFEGFIGNEPFEGGKAEDHELTLGSGQFIPGFEEQLAGVKADEETEVKVNFPEDYHAEDLKGQEATFKVKVKSIKEKELPVIDDELATEASEFDSLEELKADIRKKKEEEKAKMQESEVEKQIMDQIVEKVDVEIPEAVVKRQTDMMIRDFDMQLRYQGLELAKYLEMTGSTEDDLREQMKEDAEKRVKTQLALEKIGELEEIRPSDEDVEEELQRMAEQYGQEVEKIKETIGESERENIKENLKNKLAVDLLIKEANITEVEPEEETPENVGEDTGEEA